MARHGNLVWYPCHAEMSVVGLLRLLQIMADVSITNPHGRGELSKSLHVVEGRREKSVRRQASATVAKASVNLR